MKLNKPFQIMHGDYTILKCRIDLYYVCNTTYRIVIYNIYDNIHSFIYIMKTN